VGAGRLPGFADQAALPYCVAILKELMRWQQVVTLAIPHRLTQDDVYRGYFLPKGTTVIGNAWHVTYARATGLDADAAQGNPARRAHLPGPGRVQARALADARRSARPKRERSACVLRVRPAPLPRTTPRARSAAVRPVRRDVLTCTLLQTRCGSR
jgi:hypothetical protein